MGHRRQLLGVLQQSQMLAQQPAGTTTSSVWHSCTETSPRINAAPTCSAASTSRSASSGAAGRRAAALLGSRNVATWRSWRRRRWRNAMRWQK